MHLHSPVSEGGRSLKQYARRLEKLEIKTLRDLLYHLPFRYEDFRLISTIRQLQEGEVVTVQGKVIEAKNDYTRRFKSLQRITLADSTGTIEIIWFNQPYILKNISVGDALSVSGRVEVFARRHTILSPEYEILSEGTPTIHTGRLVPIYPETAGISSKWLRRQIFNILNILKDEIHDYLPESIRKKYTLEDLPTALRHVHFPLNFEDAIRAKRRLAFDEVFFLQLQALERKKKWEENKKGPTILYEPYKGNIVRLISSLPFTLTSSQKNALAEIFSDLQKEKPMNRLLQGEVGSGKTIIATIAMYLVYLNNYQSVLMAPTEILAEQHYKTVSTFLEPLGVSVGLVTGSKKLKVKNVKLSESEKPKSKNNMNKKSLDNSYDILIGTHSLLQETINFDNLGFVIIDEQQRFGVAQRGILRQKGKHPHTLTMTATPIPRTVALTIYGDLSVSFLNEMPKGRKIVKTWLVPLEKRQAAYEWIRQEIKTNSSQAFIICPFIEESESMQTIKAATKEFERLQKEIFPDLRLGLLHGKLKAKEKEEVLQNFRKQIFDILIATPVVEVGIDIPNATIIVIEGAERFGLAQLHQLRGRVGRSDKQSYCLLFTESKSHSTWKRLKALETMTQGAKLAEYDLELRGPGEIYGLKQSGIKLLKIASFSDIELISQARKSAELIFPHISKFPALHKSILSITNSSVNPD
jgi:ATP-dependent DNA helicase RecG